MSKSDDLLPRADARLLVSQVEREERDAKARVKAVADERRAQMEAMLSAKFQAEDEMWRDLTVEVQRLVAQVNDQVDQLIAHANEQIKQILVARGHPPSFTPSPQYFPVSLRWNSRGENTTAERRAELRKLSERRIKADEAKAAVQIQAACTKIRREIISGALTSRQARRLIEGLPTPETLLPAVKLDELEAATPLIPQPRLPYHEQGR